MLVDMDLNLVKIMCALNHRCCRSARDVSRFIEACVACMTNACSSLQLVAMFSSENVWDCFGELKCTVKSTQPWPLL